MTYRIGNATIELKDGWSEITLNNGKTVSVPHALKPGDTDKYGPTLNKDHDPLHVLVAHILRRRDSGPLSYATGEKIDPMWRHEEAVVFALQDYMHQAGITIEQVLEPYKI